MRVPCGASGGPANQRRVGSAAGPDHKRARSSSTESASCTDPRTTGRSPKRSRVRTRPTRLVCRQRNQPRPRRRPIIRRRRATRPRPTGRLAGGPTLRAAKPRTSSRRKTRRIRRSRHRGRLARPPTRRARATGAAPSACRRTEEREARRKPAMPRGVDPAAAGPTRHRRCLLRHRRTNPPPLACTLGAMSAPIDPPRAFRRPAPTRSRRPAWRSHRPAPSRELGVRRRRSAVTPTQPKVAGRRRREAKRENVVFRRSAKRGGENAMFRTRAQRRRRADTAGGAPRQGGRADADPEMSHIPDLGDASRPWTACALPCPRRRPIHPAACGRRYNVWPMCCAGAGAASVGYPTEGRASARSVCCGLGLRSSAAT